jgi:hypothetical protein
MYPASKWRIVLRALDDDPHVPARHGGASQTLGERTVAFSSLSRLQSQESRFLNADYDSLEKLSFSRGSEIAMCQMSADASVVVAAGSAISRRASGVEKNCR